MCECASGSENKVTTTKRCSVRLEVLDLGSRTWKFPVPTKDSTNTENLPDTKTDVSLKKLSKSSIREKSLKTLSSLHLMKNRNSECKLTVKQKPCRPPPAKKTKLVRCSDGLQLQKNSNSKGSQVIASSNKTSHSQKESDLKNISSEVRNHNDLKASATDFSDIPHDECLHHLTDSKDVPNKSVELSTSPPAKKRKQARPSDGLQLQRHCNTSKGSRFISSSSKTGCSHSEKESNLKNISSEVGNHNNLKTSATNFSDISLGEYSHHLTDSKDVSNKSAEQTNVGRSPSKNVTKSRRYLKDSEARNWLGLPDENYESLSKPKKKHSIPKKKPSSVSKSDFSSQKLCQSVAQISEKFRDNENVLSGSPDCEHESEDEYSVPAVKRTCDLHTNANSDQSTNAESNQYALVESQSTCSPSLVKCSNDIEEPLAGSSSALCHDYIQSNSTGDQVEKCGADLQGFSSPCSKSPQDFYLSLEPEESLFDESESDEERSYKRHPRNEQQLVNKLGQIDTRSNKSSQPLHCTANETGSTSKELHDKRDETKEISQTCEPKSVLEAFDHSRADDRRTLGKKLSLRFEEDTRAVRAKADEPYTYSQSKEAYQRDNINAAAKDNRKNLFGYSVNQGCHAYYKTGMCHRKNCKYRHCPPRNLKFDEFMASAVTDYYMWRSYVHDYEFLPVLNEFCRTGRLNLAFKHVCDHIENENFEVQSEAVLFLLRASISMKEESFVKCVIDFVKPNLLTINFCSDFIIICGEDSSVSFPVCQHMLSLCKKGKIPLKAEAVVALFKIFEDEGSDWSEVLSLMIYINEVCRQTIPVNIFEKALRAVNETKKLDLISKMTFLKQNVDEDYLSRVDLVSRRVFEEIARQASDCNTEACSADQPLKQTVSMDKKTAKLLQNYVTQDRWIKVEEYFRNSAIEDTSGDIVETIHDAIFSHGELLGEKYMKFIREVSGSREINLGKKSLLGQLGVALVLEAHQNGMMKAAFTVLEAMHSYGIFYMDLQPLVIPETVKYAVNVCITHSWVALVVADVCVRADQLEDAIQILKATSWATPSEKLNSAVRNYELSFRLRLLIKLSSVLLKHDECEVGAEVMDVLLTSVTREIDELYSSYLAALSNKRNGDLCVTLCKHMIDLRAITKVKLIILRSLIILWFPIPQYKKNVEELFHQITLRGLYPFDLLEHPVEPYALKLPTYLSKAEFFLIIQLYMDNFFTRIKKTQFSSISIIFKEETVTEKEPHLTLVHELNCDIAHTRKRFIKMFRNLFEGIDFCPNHTKDILRLNEDAVLLMFYKWKEAQLSKQSVDSGNSNFPTPLSFETSSVSFGDKCAPNSKQGTAFQKDVGAPFHPAEPKFPTPPSSHAAFSRSSSLSSERDSAQFHHINGKTPMSPSSSVHHSVLSSAAKEDLIHKPQMPDNDGQSESSLPPECEFSSTSSPKNITDSEDSAGSRPTSPQSRYDGEEYIPHTPDAQNISSDEASSPRSGSFDGEEYIPHTPDPQNITSDEPASPRSGSSGKSQGGGSSTSESNCCVESAAEHGKDSSPKFLLISKSRPVKPTSDKIQKLNRPRIFGTGSEFSESIKPLTVANLEKPVTQIAHSAEAARTNTLRKDNATVENAKESENTLPHSERFLSKKCESGTESDIVHSKIVQFLMSKMLLKYKVQPEELESRATDLCELFLNSEESGQITKLCKSNMKRLTVFAQEHI